MFEVLNWTNMLVDPSYSASPCWMSRPTADYTSGKYFYYISARIKLWFTEEYMKHLVALDFTLIANVA